MEKKPDDLFVRSHLCNSFFQEEDLKVFGIFAAAAALPSSYVHVEVPAEPYIHQEVPVAFISFIILMFSIVIFNSVFSLY